MSRVRDIEVDIDSEYHGGHHSDRGEYHSGFHSEYRVHHNHSNHSILKKVEPRGELVELDSPEKLWTAKFTSQPMVPGSERALGSERGELYYINGIQCTRSQWQYDHRCQQELFAYYESALALQAKKRAELTDVGDDIASKDGSAYVSDIVSEDEWQ